MTDLLSIPSPSQGVWHLGPIPIRAYALCILAGIVVAWTWASRRWVARGGTRDDFEAIMSWAVGAGIVGARLYHVITDYELYFGPGRQWWRMFFIWEGGLGIWGAVALGALAVWWQTRRRGLSFGSVAGAVAPALPVAQALGRLGNWFNQELYGRPTTLPWGLEIDPAHRIAGYEQYATYHPTFLYELLWCLAIAAVLVVCEKRFALRGSQVFTLYIALYTFGRFWIESLRIDPVNTPGGFRLNNYTSVIVFAGAVAVFWWLSRRTPAPAPSPVAADPAADGRTDDRSETGAEELPAAADEAPKA